ncbi:DMT family transporter [Photobacterium aphoticum]|uniref:Uncharacterized protein n=1 Tax=Photobacterium aphoticum TaxID=754436 RepID=A0A0J1GQ74_9GAMM|nr:SMR family transporter [Photobacterium aphoticum]KLV01791.1 hypothetical protein ABT58_05015 [Photobacterium aphoticum]PSU58723.1 QacE family quaternary ammonium compound efflux SMR transporter [Photobacterium aphoticum]GHA32490.1 hypothetical protein GCM10007086_02030 [Photobacterium aphoticum]
MGWLFLFLGVMAEATSHVALRATNGFTHWLPSAIVLLGHLLAFLFLGQAMKSIPVGVVHASFAGLAILIVTSLSSIFIPKLPQDTRFRVSPAQPIQEK